MRGEPACEGLPRRSPFARALSDLPHVGRCVRATSESTLRGHRTRCQLGARNDPQSRPCGEGIRQERASRPRSEAGSLGLHSTTSALYALPIRRRGVARQGGWERTLSLLLGLSPSRRHQGSDREVRSLTRRARDRPAGTRPVLFGEFRHAIWGIAAASRRSCSTQSFIPVWVKTRPFRDQNGFFYAGGPERKTVGVSWNFCSRSDARWLSRSETKRRLAFSTVLCQDGTRTTPPHEESP